MTVNMFAMKKMDITVYTPIALQEKKTNIAQRKLMHR